MVSGMTRMCTLLITGVLVMAGCGQQTDSPAQVEVTPKMEEILAQADTLDGETDNLVTLCASCSLGMDGLKEYSLDVDEYTLYFCKDYCKQRFSKDIGQSVLSMKIPAADESD